MSDDTNVRSVFKNSRAEWRFCYYPPGAQMAPHRHDCAQLSLVLSGLQREVAANGEVDMSGLTMQFKPTHFQHGNKYGDDGALLLSLNLFHIDDDDCEIVSNAWRIRSADPVRREWGTLARELSQSAQPDEAFINDITDDLLSAVLSTPPDYSPSATPPLWLLCAREAFTETDMDTAAVASEVGVHRVHLSRSFRKYFGVSVTEYKRRVRIARAATAIIRDHIALAGASHSGGFADQPHLTRDMRRETGLTPGALARIFAA